MSQLADFLISVGGFAVLAAAGAAWLLRRPSSAAARRFLAAVVAAYVVLSIFAVPYAAVRLLALGYHPFTATDVPQGRTAIVLLGAGGTNVVDWTRDHYSLLERGGAARVLEAARVFRMVPGAVVISSGGVGNDKQDVDAVMQRQALLLLGVPAASIVLEDRSQNTHDEAVLIAPMLKQLGVSRVILVTSDFHMRRSMAVFRAAGVDAVAAMARDPRADDPWRVWLLPARGGLDLSAEVVHELLGIVYYTARGWARF